MFPSGEISCRLCHRSERHPTPSTLQPPRPEAPLPNSLPHLLLTRLFLTQGRLARRSYVLIGLAQAAALFVALYIIIAAFFTWQPQNLPIPREAILYAAIGLIALLHLWVTTATIGRRLHDMNLSAAHTIWIIPAHAALGLAATATGAGPAGALAIGWLTIPLILATIPGTPGPNSHGPSPATTARR